MKKPKRKRVKIKTVEQLQEADLKAIKRHGRSNN